LSQPFTCNALGCISAVTLTQLEKAHAELQRLIAIWDRVATGTDQDLTETTRSGVVQNFEVAYEQSWKVMRHWISALKARSQDE
jgi:N-acetyl-beta-hexosaminidase